MTDYTANMEIMTILSSEMSPREAGKWLSTATSSTGKSPFALMRVGRSNDALTSLRSEIAAKSKKKV